MLHVCIMLHLTAVHGEGVIYIIQPSDVVASLHEHYLMLLTQARKHKLCECWLTLT